MFHCLGCLHHEDFKDALAIFPRKNVIHIKKALKFGLVERRALQDETNRIVKDLDKKCKKQYRTPFTKQFKKSLSGLVRSGLNSLVSDRKMRIILIP